MGNCTSQKRVEPVLPAQAQDVPLIPKLISLDVDSQTGSSSDSPRRSTDSRSSQNSLQTTLPREKRQQQQLATHSTTSSFVENYHILRHEILGRGIAGVVHKCIHRPSSQACAVKVITKSKLRCKERVKREISILQQVQQHPNIIQLYDVYEDDTTVYIVTELCRGGELYEKIVQLSESKRRSIIKSGGIRSVKCFHERDAAHIIRSVLSAVFYLHSNDIVHRDLKPENILLVKDTKESKLRNLDDGSPISSPSSSSSSFSSSASSSPYNVKLIDFGLSVHHTPQDGQGPLQSVVGTSYYMAPEVLDGSYDRSCDLWSIGVITYAMLTGRPPFNGKENQEIYEKIRNYPTEMEESPEEFWEGIHSEKARDFIRRLLVKDPRRRYTADMALDHSWLKTPLW